MKKKIEINPFGDTENLKLNFIHSASMYLSSKNVLHYIEIRYRDI